MLHVMGDGNGKIVAREGRGFKRKRRGKCRKRDARARASGAKKGRSGQIVAILIPKRPFYPTFAVEAKLPFPMETGG